MCGSSSSLKVHKRNIHSDDGFVCAEDGCGKKVKTKVGALFVQALRIRIFIVVDHVTIIAIGHGLFKKF